MIKFQQSQALTSHFESFWSIVLYMLEMCFDFTVFFCFQDQKLCVPQIFAKSLPNILTCGKSITILTILEKQSVLFPGYKSAFTPIQDMVAPTELYDSFLSNMVRKTRSPKSLV